MADPVTMGVGGAVVLIHKLLSPATKEIGEELRQRVAQWRQRMDVARQERALRVAREAGEKLLARGVQPHSENADGFFQILEATGDSDDETLNDMFAELLATELTPTRQTHPSFSKVLAQLAPLDAKLLIRMYPLDRDYRTGIFDRHFIRIGAIAEELLGHEPSQEDWLAFEIAASNLERLGLCASGIPAVDPYQMRLTDYGYRFVQACTPPKVTLPEN